MRRRHFRWWSKYNFILSAGLDSGTILSALVIFFTLQLPKGGSICASLASRLLSCVALPADARSSSLRRSLQLVGQHGLHRDGRLGWHALQDSAARGIRPDDLVELVLISHYCHLTRTL